MDIDFDPDVELPPDFVEFIQRNYERIQEVERKVEEFRDSWRKTLDVKQLFKLRYKKLFESVDSCFSDGDIKKVISAKLRPRKAHLSDSDSDERTECVAKYLTEQASTDPELEYYNIIKKTYPLVQLDYHQRGEGKSGENAIQKLGLIIEGKNVLMIDRDNYNQIPVTLRISPSIIRPSTLKGTWGQKKSNKNRYRRCRGEIETNPKYHKLSDIDKKKYGLQLSLPPLHSSVLALLGQKPEDKPTPRVTLQGQHSQQQESAGGAKLKKLRRHGRTRKGGDKEDNGSGQRAGYEDGKKTDDPRDTQISAIPDPDGENDAKAKESELDESLQAFEQNLNEFKTTRRALYNVVDDYMTGQMRSAQDLEAIEEQIIAMEGEFRKLDTKFNTQGIQLKETMWLGVPRTWSRNSASFGVPRNLTHLKQMTSLEYLQKCVTFSGPRKHLYSLIFQRYRTMENPTKDYIWIKTLPPALSEVLGRPLSEEDGQKFCHTFLGIDDPEYQIAETTFMGISAFCERIYGEFSLEESNECFECCTIPDRNKNMCHRNQKSELEKADLSYLYIKAKDKQLTRPLSNLIAALCEKD